MSSEDEKKAEYVRRFEQKLADGIQDPDARRFWLETERGKETVRNVAGKLHDAAQGSKEEETLDAMGKSWRSQVKKADAGKKPPSR